MRKYGKWRCSCTILDLSTLEKRPQKPSLYEAVWAPGPGIECRFPSLITKSTDGWIELNCYHVSYVTTASVNQSRMEHCLWEVEVKLQTS
jgi:hypothetical protein